jgi:hypothetical protein
LGLCEVPPRPVCAIHGESHCHRLPMCSA